MLIRNVLVWRRAVLSLAALAVLAWAHQAWAGGFGRSSAVGGVVVTAEGVLRNPEVDELNQLKKIRAEILRQLPGTLKQAVPLRKISLRRLQETIQTRIDKVQMPYLTEEMQYLGGLTRIKYIFIYPEENDIVLAGPAEPITVDGRGHMVGAETGSPILQLDHLLVALRSAESAAQNPISCSIDPTPEGLARFQAYWRKQKVFSPRLAKGVEKALGPQRVTLTGVSPKTDFARTMVAADFRMKRLAMGLEPSGIRGLPSYLSMISGGGLNSATPRWWMAPNYDRMLKSPDGTAWELRGGGIKVMTEDSFVTETGGPKRTGKSSPAAQKWADAMTSHFDELSHRHAIFGEMRNVMDMAVIGALIVKERLADQANCDLSLLMDESKISTEGFNVPKTVNTIASVKKSGRKYIISASGGVEVSSWHVADRVQASESLAPVRKDAQHQGAHWWWN